MSLPTFLFSIFDSPETATYTSGSIPSFDVTVIRRPLTQSRMRNIERYVELEATDVVFYLDASMLLGIPVAVGDSLSDVNGVSYQTVFVERQTLNNIVVVVCRPIV